ncbi:MAG: hypothetical protein JNG83_03940 [Opitutaceae bacterium]|nr:hypothetical protein [Opitutaceae bacterium]
MKPKFLLACAVAAAAFCPSARAELTVSVAAEIRLGHRPPPPPPAVVVVEEAGPKGPPPWAARHWYKRSRAYYYYPGCDVYYRPADRMWFYLEGGDWRASVTLPAAIGIDFGHCVTLTLETDRPYVFHRDVVTYYPGNYFTRVRIRDAAEVGRGHDDRDRGDHGPGRAKGRGRDKRDH